MDLLGSMLLTLKVIDTSICSFELAPPWGFSIPRQTQDRAIIFSPIDTQCWLTVEQNKSVLIEAGDSALVLRGAPHVIQGSLDAPIYELPVAWHDQGLPETGNDKDNLGPIHFRWNQHLSPAKPLQRILGLEIIIQDSTKNAVLGLLPSLVIVQRNTGRMFPWLPSGQEFLLQEEHSTLPGYEVTARHLATLIFTSLVRAHITVEGTADANWLRGLSDPKVGKALTIMHSKFKEPWTIQTLANACGMSRTNFMRKFVTLVGTTPMAHLNSIRMSEAAQQLDTGAPAGQVATNIGYKSDCAFRRAFSLRYGCTPSQYTKNHKEN